MGKKEKLIARFSSKTKDFKYPELKCLLDFFSYTEEQASGSRVVFVNKQSDHKIKFHNTHPDNVLKIYQIELIEKELKFLELL
jgi:hypothetical protein